MRLYPYSQTAVSMAREKSLNPEERPLQHPSMFLRRVQQDTATLELYSLPFRRLVHCAHLTSETVT